MAKKNVVWQKAEDLKKRTLHLIKVLNLDWLLNKRIFFYRSTGSAARAYARTWGLPRLWQEVLDVKPAYIIEIISEHFDRLDKRRQDEVIIHELLHIPKSFSGSLTPHTKSGHNNFRKKLKQMISILNKSKENKRKL